MKSVSIVIPLYNEAGVVQKTHAILRTIVDGLPYDFRFIYVDDGSIDDTAASLEELKRSDPRITPILLSRNFGHQAALTAGIQNASGDILVTMDGDGQHPANMIPQMLDLLNQGYDVVQTQRIDQSEPPSFKKWSSESFYRVINLMSGTHILPGTADFRALSRQAADALRSMPEYHRFLRGMVAWIGYPTVILPYQAADRISGQSKYSFGKMFRLAMDAIFSFSLVPLYIGLTAGGILLCLALAEIIYVLSFWVTGRTTDLAPGWSSLMFVILIIGGMLMVLLGFIGVYIGYIFQEVKRRPIYIIKGDRSAE
jgi:dolichol-phosphate mannosyltransferase